MTDEQRQAHARKSARRRSQEYNEAFEEGAKDAMRGLGYQNDEADDSDRWHGYCRGYSSIRAAEEGQAIAVERKLGKV